MVKLYNDLPTHQVGDGQVMVELGDLYAEETRKLLMRFRVPGMAALGLADIASLELRYVEMPALVEQTVVLPIAVNVVPGDEAAGRLADPVVRSELLFQEAQQSKRRASEAFEAGDVPTGKRLLRAASDDLDLALASASGEARDDLVREVGEISGMYEDVDSVGSNVMSKRTRASFYRQSTKRGRRDPTAPSEDE
jgi:Ca-activated chloride channel family protein